MLVLLGYLITIVCVFGGFVMGGGTLLSLVQPSEFVIIGGAALGAFVLGNNAKVIKSVGRSIATIGKGRNYSREFYIELLSLFFIITNKIKKDGVLAIEADVEDYRNSAMFNQFGLVVKEHRIMEFMCDHLRLIVTGRVNSLHLEELLSEDIETYEKEAELPIGAINKVADGMPAFGIVAAVMGVVTTMQHIDGPPSELGHHVAAALVGTFLGVLMGYGFIAPLAGVLEMRLKADMIILESIKLVLIASINNLAPSIAVEFARKVLYASERPTSQELEQIIKDVRSNKPADQQAAQEETVQ